MFFHGMLQQCSHHLVLPCLMQMTICLFLRITETNFQNSQWKLKIMKAYFPLEKLREQMWFGKKNGIYLTINMMLTKTKTEKRQGLESSGVM